VIPFDAITGFADPSVKFGLQFQLLTASDATIAKDEKADQDTGEDSDDGDDAPDANARGEVVSLDQFRKKK
jgi:hypothetical protein